MCIKVSWVEVYKDNSQPPADRRISSFMRKYVTRVRDFSQAVPTFGQPSFPILSTLTFACLQRFSPTSLHAPELFLVIAGHRRRQDEKGGRR